MITYSIYSEYFDRGWLVQAADEKAAKKKVRQFVLKNFGESEASGAKKAKDIMQISDVFSKVDILEMRDV